MISVSYPDKEWFLRNKKTGWFYDGPSSAFDLHHINYLFRAIGVQADCVSMSCKGKLVFENNFQSKFPLYIPVERIWVEITLKREAQFWKAMLSKGLYIDDVERSADFVFDAYHRDYVSILFEHLGKPQDQPKKYIKFSEDFNGDENPKPKKEDLSHIQPITLPPTEEELKLQEEYLEMLLGEESDDEED